MFADLFHFGSGTQAVHYFVWCLVANLGVIQAVAARYGRRDLQWFEGRKGYILAVLAVVGGPLWFFWIDDEAFLPGLAGGELFADFTAAFLLAILATRLVAFLLPRIRMFGGAPQERAGQKEPLA